MLFETGQQGSLLGNADYDGQLLAIHFQAPGCGLWFASLAGMKKQLWLLTGILWLAASLKAQKDESVVKKNTVSIRTVERGSMSTFSSARGTLTSQQPRRAVLTFDNNGGRCDSGRSARWWSPITQSHLRARSWGTLMLETVRSNSPMRYRRAP
jgi:hypothetical protein